MPTRPPLYGTQNGRNLFTSVSTSTSSTTQGELDLREELDEIFYGFQSGIRHGHLIVIRNLRR